MSASTNHRGGMHVFDLTAEWLHARVCELRRRTRRRLFDPALDLVCSAVPPRPLIGCRLPATEPLDHALRVELLVRLLASAGPDHRGCRLHLVLTRPGPAEVTRTDLSWYASWQVACGVAGITGTAGVDTGTAATVTRYGFVDVAGDRVTPTQPRRHRR